MDKKKKPAIAKKMLKNKGSYSKEAIAEARRMCV